MTKLERLKWLKEIEKDIHVCSLESTFADDAKSCAIHSVIEELEKCTSGVIKELEKIKEEIVELEKKMGQGIFTVELASEIVNDHIAELKGDKE